jgi:hypothetical protein
MLLEYTRLLQHVPPDGGAASGSYNEGRTVGARRLSGMSVVSREFANKLAGALHRRRADRRD